MERSNKRKNDESRRDGDRGRKKKTSSVDPIAIAQASAYNFGAGNIIGAVGTSAATAQTFGPGASSAAVFNFGGSGNTFTNVGTNLVAHTSSSGSRSVNVSVGGKVVDSAIGLGCSRSAKARVRVSDAAAGSSVRVGVGAESRKCGTTAHSKSDSVDYRVAFDDGTVLDVGLRSGHAILECGPTDASSRDEKWVRVPEGLITFTKHSVEMNGMVLPFESFSDKRIDIEDIVAMFADAKEELALISVPDQDVDDDSDEEHTCRICGKRKIASIITPCNHAATCIACAIELDKKDKKNVCPKCKGPIEHKIPFAY